MNLVHGNDGMQKFDLRLAFKPSQLKHYYNFLSRMKYVNAIPYKM